MNRLDFLKQTGNLACAACTGLVLSSSLAAEEKTAASAPDVVTPVDVALKKAQEQDAFTKNWLGDMMDAMDSDLPAEAKARLFEACGKQCFKRHKFKTDIAEAGKGDLEKLIAAYRKSFGDVSREGDVVHIRFGGGCYCPAAQGRPARPNDPQCDCQKGTHMAIFEAALGRKFRADVAESIRRGGKICHIRVFLS
jgi:hypothetical protein